MVLALQARKLNQTNQKELLHITDITEKSLLSFYKISHVGRLVVVVKKAAYWFIRKLINFKAYWILKWQNNCQNN